MRIRPRNLFVLDSLDEVCEQIYPGPEHTIYMKDDELTKFAKGMKWDSKLEELEKRKRV